MLEKLMKRLGWVRATSTASFVAECMAARSMALELEYKLNVVRQRNKEVTKLLHEALSPRVTPLVKAHLNKPVLGRHEEHASLYTVYTVRLPEIVLHATDEWFPRSASPERMEEYIVQVWAAEFQRGLPDAIRRMRNDRPV